MTVQIDGKTGAGPTTAAWTSAKWNRVDSQSGTTVIPTPTSTGTEFSFVKTFRVEITATGSLTMTDIKFGKVANETTTGTKLWYKISSATYVQATAAPNATGDNNTTAPALPSDTDGGNNTSVAAVPLISGASAYDAGPYNTTGEKGNLVWVALGVDATNTTAGASTATPTLRWQWTES